MKENSDCIIWKLLSGKLEVSMVYQDDCCSAFMDIQPVNAGHMLVVSNRHAPYLLERRGRCANVSSSAAPRRGVTGWFR
jgi:histidine triad (HIT) family protein